MNNTEEFEELKSAAAFLIGVSIIWTLFLIGAAVLITRWVILK